MKKEIEVKKRKWVAPASAVFFAVMFFLTLFSNQIMNRSLPEVAAQYTQSASITARIRGTAAVSANEIFEVQTEQAYTVSSVPVKVGDTVETGDVLLTLESGGSDELEQAKMQLHTAELELERKLASTENNSFVDLNNAVATAQDYLREEQRARSNAQHDYDQAKRERDAINYNEDAYRNAKNAIEAAEAALAAGMAEEEIAQRNLDTFISTFVPTNPSQDQMGMPEYMETQTYKDLLGILNAAKEKAAGAQNELTRLRIDTGFASLETARALWLEASSKVDSIYDNFLAPADSKVAAAERALSSARDSLAQAQRNVSVSNSLFEIDVREMRNNIDELEDKIEELEKTGSESEITAPVSGKITSISITAGSTTPPGSPLIVIEMTDRGYSLSIPVTSEQSTRVSIGEAAEVDRGWYWGSQISAVLTNIRPDPQNPGGGRLLVFSVTGDDIESGTQLSITMAQRSENYGIVVPKSAIRTDTNGDFVLIVETRPSPLRNRYIARRVDVTIIASDDVNAAISGPGLGGWDFVITTSTRPIEPGMQIRLVDNP